MIMENEWIISFSIYKVMLLKNKQDQTLSDGLILWRRSSSTASLLTIDDDDNDEPKHLSTIRWNLKTICK